jgi:hypothetical protein
MSGLHIRLIDRIKPKRQSDSNRRSVEFVADSGSPDSCPGTDVMPDENFDNASQPRQWQVVARPPRELSPREKILEEQYGFDPRVTSLFPPGLAWDLRVFPVQKKGNILVIVCKRELTAEEREKVEVGLRREKPEFVVDSGAFPKVRLHLDRLLELYYAPDGPTLPAKPQTCGAQSGR